MAFAPHTRVTMLAEFRSLNGGAEYEIAQPGFSLSLASVTPLQATNIAGRIEDTWGTDPMTIPSTCRLQAVRFSSIDAAGHQVGQPIIIVSSDIPGTSNSNRPTFQALCATLESQTAGALRRRRGRIFFPSGANCVDGLLSNDTTGNFATQVAALLSDVNAQIEGDGGHVCTASRTDGTNHQVTSVTADNIPDYISNRKHQLSGTRSGSFPVN